MMLAGAIITGDLSAGMRSAQGWPRIVLAGIIMIAVLTIYFLPSIVAQNRRHPNLVAIAAANAFFGWTFIGWAACFVWALMNPPAATSA
jgi:hypothetical protein